MNFSAIFLNERESINDSDNDSNNDSNYNSDYYSTTRKEVTTRKRDNNKKESNSIKSIHRYSYRNLKRLRVS